jgi:hypothetical protein
MQDNKYIKGELFNPDFSSPNVSKSKQNVEKKN